MLLRFLQLNLVHCRAQNKKSYSNSCNPKTTSAAERRAQGLGLPAKKPKFGLQNFRTPWNFARESKRRVQKQDRWCPLSSLLTCSGAQQEDKDGLLTKVLNGKVSLFTSYRTVQPLIAIAFPNNKIYWLFWLFSVLFHSSWIYCCPDLLRQALLPWLAFYHLQLLCSFPVTLTPRLTVNEG